MLSSHASVSHPSRDISLERLHDTQKRINGTVGRVLQSSDGPRRGGVQSRLLDTGRMEPFQACG